MTARQKALVLDANILIRAVLGAKVRDLIVANADQVNFFVPRVCVADAQKYIPEILSERGVDPAPAIALLNEIVRYLQILEDEWLQDFDEVAKKRMQSRDPDDWPVLAAATGSALSEAGSAGGVDEAAVSIGEIAQKIIENYERCRVDQSRLHALQEITKTFCIDARIQ